MRIQRQVEAFAYALYPTAPTPDRGASPMHHFYRKYPLDSVRSKDYEDGDARNAVGSTQGRANAPVTVYRILPKGQTSLRPGDWVSPSSNYLDWLQNRSTLNLDPDSHIIRATVPAKHLYGLGDPVRWGYHGPEVDAHTTDPLKEAAHTILLASATLGDAVREIAPYDSTIPYAPSPDEPFADTPYWFHASPYKLESGTVLTPHGGKTTWNRFYNQLDPEEAQKIQSHVWLDNNINESANRAYGRGHYIYRVEPTTKPQDLGLSGGGYSTDSARVVELIGQTPKRQRKREHRSSGHKEGMARRVGPGSYEHDTQYGTFGIQSVSDRDRDYDDDYRGGGTSWYLHPPDWDGTPSMQASDVFPSKADALAAAKRMEANPDTYALTPINKE